MFLFLNSPFFLSLDGVSFCKLSTPHLTLVHSPLLKVSIIPRGIAALGYAMTQPKDQVFHTQEGDAPNCSFISYVLVSFGQAWPTFEKQKAA